MRRFLALPYRRLLMHFDPTRPSSSSSNPAATLTGSKRPFSQQAVALPDNLPSSSKAPRIDFSQRSPRRNSSPPPYSSSQRGSNMSSSRGPPPRSKGGSSSGFGYKHKAAGGPGSSFSKSPKKKPQTQQRRLLFEGPLNDEEYIVREYKKSPLPLKPLHESTPKSSLGNFSMLAAGKTPTYTFSEGSIMLDSRPKNIWRYVLQKFLPNRLSCLTGRP